MAKIKNQSKAWKIQIKANKQIWQIWQIWPKTKKQKNKKKFNEHVWHKNKKYKRRNSSDCLKVTPGNMHAYHYITAYTPGLCLSSE